MCPQLSQGLKVQAYPYVALLAFSGARTRLIAAAEGHFTAEALLPVLRDAQEQQAIHLLAEQVEHNERVCLLVQACIGRLGFKLSPLNPQPDPDPA